MSKNYAVNMLNKTLMDLEIYASKAISLQAKKDPEIANLSFGEPEFGPPEHSLENIAENQLTITSFLDSVKRYEDPRGSIRLRESISNWYKKRYGLIVNPETEIMITHGGVEAITLAILCTSDIYEQVAVTDPSYMLYSRTITTLGRRAVSLQRVAGSYEYQSLFNKNAISNFKNLKTIIINSPENPTGYVVDKDEWELIGNYADKTGIWIIHDEVYDTMAFKREHIPCKAIDSLSERSILINSFSKKFGIPGLRIGWIVANKKLVDLASKLHDYLYLGVNIQYENIANNLISDERNMLWLANIAKKIKLRAEKALVELGDNAGFTWTRSPQGAMFLFPNVRTLYESLSAEYKSINAPIGDVVSDFLIKEKKVATVPGSVYGKEGNEHIRMVLCTADVVFNQALERLKA